MVCGHSVQSSKGMIPSKPAHPKLHVKDVRLEMSLTEADSIKTITVKAFIKVNGTEKPVSGEAVKVYVPRMFSLLPISELTLDETRNCKC